MPTLILHGGAGRIEEARTGAYERGLATALAAGWAVLERGGEALDAVLAAVQSMEADPSAFNAGIGSSLTRDGTVECDACLVDGRDGSAGAVALVTRSASPIRLARAVLERTPHVLLAGVGADALEEDPVDPDTLVTPHARAQLERWRARHAADVGSAAEPTGSATVGAVALDAAGALAAATSTGGVIGQWPGRIGDAAVPGAGTYADGAVGVSCTGKGEAFLRAVTGKALAERLAAGASPGHALARALDDVAAMGGSGGLIVALADGQLAWAFDTAHLALAWRTADAEHVSVTAEPGVTVRP